MIYEIILVIAGLIGLWIGTELVIKGSINISRHFKISPMFIGLTILAFGTDLPELVITITASIQRYYGTETSGIVIGDAIGSCFGQIGLTLGIVSLVGYLTLTKRGLFRDGFLMLGSIVILFLLGYDGTLTRLEGLLLIVVYLLYIFIIQGDEKIHEKVLKAPSMDLGWDALSLAAGLFVVIYSSHVVVGNSIMLANLLGIKQSLIGALIIGLGTSLPELVISLGALYKKETSLSVGNLIGSNIFDILMVLGVGSLISPLVFTTNMILFDIPFLFLISTMALLFFIIKRGIQKKESIALIVAYIVYALLKLKGF